MSSSGRDSGGGHGGGGAFARDTGSGGSSSGVGGSPAAGGRASRFPDAGGPDASAGAGATRGAADASVMDGGAERGGSGAGGKIDAADADGGQGSVGCAAQVSAGADQTCAVKKDGTLWCWGANDLAELGDGMVVDHSLVPLQVTALGNTVVEVGTNSGRTCARQRDGVLWCWGVNSTGAIGDGTTTGDKTCGGSVPCRTTPARVLLTGHAAGLGMGAWHTCARTTDGSLYCWGLNDDGQIGQGTLRRQSCGGASYCEPTPVAVTTVGSHVTEVVSGASFSCARLDDGSVWCWGNNIYDQLGYSWGQFHCSTGQGYCSPTPLQVTPLGTTVTQITAGPFHTCARKSDGSLWCWGMNNWGQLGDGTRSGDVCGPSMGQLCKLTPVNVSALGTAVVSTSGGATAQGSTCAITSDGSVWCWGDIVADSPTPVRIAGFPRRAVQISVGVGGHACAILDDASAWCWGSNSMGKLGDGTSTDSPSPVKVKLCP